MPPPSALPQSATARRSWSRRSASWTPDEDAKLIELVKKETSVPPSITASKTWSRVAAQLTKRTGKQCRERYLNQLKPGIRRDPWSSEEERILHQAHARYGNKWVTIASQLPGRTDNCVKNHWNSMLRKRQRREAALKAAEKEVTATLGHNPQSPTPPLKQHNSDPDHSAFTPCATPSGASSSAQDFPPSGVPSPYTASSPITPKRDAKLQISSLVAASTKEVPDWNLPYYTRQASRHPTAAVVNSADCNQGVLHPINGKQIATSVSAPLCVAPRPGDPSTPSTRHEAVVLRSGNHVQTLPNSSPPPHSRLPAISSLNPPGSQSLNPPGSQALNISQSRPLRRSTRLVSLSARDSHGQPHKFIMSDIQKRPISKTRHSHSGVGNPLAALAAAASSVPPSPLTPESRFSTTSRSRSVSPNPGVWHIPVTPTAIINTAENDTDLHTDGKRNSMRTAVTIGSGYVGRLGTGNEKGKVSDAAGRSDVTTKDMRSRPVITTRKSARYRQGQSGMADSGAVRYDGAKNP